MEKIQKFQTMFFSFLVISGIGLSVIFCFGDIKEYHLFAIFLFLFMLPKVFLEFLLLFEKMHGPDVWQSFLIALFYYIVVLNLIPQLFFPNAQPWLWIMGIVSVTIFYNWGAYRFQKKYQVDKKIL